MALTVVQHVAGTVASGDLLITIAATGAGNLLVCAAQNNAAADIVSVSDGTNNFTQFPSAKATANAANRRMDIWYLPVSTSGATTITVHWTASGVARSGEVWEVSGFSNPTTDGANVLNDGAGVGTTDTGAALTTTATTGFVVGAVVSATGQTVTANPKAANEFTSGGDASTISGYVSLISSSAAGHTPEWTMSLNDTDFAASTVAFKEGAARVAVAVSELLIGQAINRAAVR
jgi:hypothetical protein